MRPECASGVSPLFGGYSDFGEREEDGGIWFDESDGLQQGGSGRPKDGSHPVAGCAHLTDRHVRVHLPLQQEQQDGRNLWSPSVTRRCVWFHLLGKSDGRQGGGVLQESP